MNMIVALRHCQDICDQAAAMMVAAPDAALRKKQLYLLRECADTCASVARTLSRSGRISEETALRCARILRECARECTKHLDPFSRHCARACLYAAFVCRNSAREGRTKLKDHGGKPFVVDIHRAARHNRTFRTALWTGEHLQVTVMSIDVGEDIGLERHPDTDQFLRIEQGRGRVLMGKRRDRLDFEAEVRDDDAIMVPAGIWHNVINTGDVPLKLYSIYAPPEHPFGTVHKTKRDAEEAER
jgi:mannose-6-phosphate isomerase-like protein (cupin superfamily)